MNVLKWKVKNFLLYFFIGTLFCACKCGLGPCPVDPPAVSPKTITVKVNNIQYLEKFYINNIDLGYHPSCNMTITVMRLDDNGNNLSQFFKKTYLFTTSEINTLQESDFVKNDVNIPSQGMYKITCELAYREATYMYWDGTCRQNNGTKGSEILLFSQDQTLNTAPSTIPFTITMKELLSATCSN